MRRVLVLALCGGMAGWAATYFALAAVWPATANDTLRDGRAEALTSDFHERAANDATAALAALRSFESRTERFAAGLGILDVLGDDEGSLAAVAAALPPGDAEHFTIEALAWRARSVPELAADQALALESAGARFRAVRRVAREWALLAPAAAMAYGKTLANAALRNAFCEEVLAQWWRLDPSAAIDAGADLSFGPLVGTVGVYDPLAPAIAVAPEAALAALGKYPSAAQRRIRTLAQNALVEREPAAARAAAESMMAGQERDQLLRYVAENLVRRDPDAAIAWVESLNPPSSIARSALVQGLARVDFDRAVDVALGDTVGLLVINLPLEQHPDRLPALMDRLFEGPRGLGVASVGADQRRDMVLGRWASFDPEGALGWLVDRGVTEARLVGVVAGRFMTRDAQAAAAAVQRLPSALQPAWINAVVMDFATSNPSQALSWIDQFRGRQGYDDWVTTIVQTAAGRDPEVAANILRTGDASVRRNTPYVAQRWAQQDPLRASQWAVSLAEPAERDAAAAMIAAEWANADADAARRWAFSAPGSMRDAAIAALFERQLGPLGLARNVDVSLLDAIGDRATSQRLVRVALPSLARDPVQARELVDRFVFDPAEKRAALEELERLQR